MCGIVGVVSALDITERKWLKNASETLFHRGPDHSGEWWSKDNKAGFAHQRLSILDLSSSANQPMYFTKKNICIVFNGEIYNYRKLRKKLQTLGHEFKTNSDTEVLLASYAQWGTECPKYLDGMFAFAIYDLNSQNLFIARDRAGEKPLFYYFENDTFFFASELKALLSNNSLKKKIDIDATDCYFAMGFVPGSRCILSQYQKLSPGHALSFDIKTKKLDIWSYWQLPKFKNKTENFDQNLLVKKLQKLLENSVEKQLVADVDVGILLSGGLDSSLITAVASKYSKQVKTFNVRFPGYNKFDETENARLIASHFKTKHTELIVDKNTNLADLLIELSKQYDEPIVDSSIFPTYLICNLIRKQCKVAIGGDGGDELFGGYNHYSSLMRLEKYLKYIPKSMTQNLAKFINKILPPGMKGHNFSESLKFDLIKNIPFTVPIFSQNTRKQLLNKFSNHINVAESIHLDRIQDDKDLIQRATRMDFENYLPEDILVKVDRASMLNSLEIRAPFLDFNIINFAFKNVPSRYKVTKKNKKILLKQLASKILPAKFDANRKQGFSIPLNEWLKKGPLRDLFWDTLSSQDCMFDKKITNILLEGQDHGRNNSERLLAIVQFELWRKNFKIVF
jgi:asparagine synthase (glutamine-hydrolysing)